jgi:hypothetical protein
LPVAIAAVKVRAVSIFPRRVVPGGAVTLHVAMRSPPVQFGHLRVSVRDPRGRVAVVSECPFLSVPSVGRRAAKRLAIAPGVLEVPPLVLVADRLRGDLDGGDTDLLSTLQAMTASTHRYATYDVPADALPGRYFMVAEVFADGRRAISQSAPSDCFVVESLRLAGMRGRGRRRAALVDNPSTEPVPAKLCELRDRGAHIVCTSRMVVLPADRQTEIPCARTATFLFYAGDRAWLSLRDRGAPLCVRNPRCAWVVREDGVDEVYVRHPGEERIHVLRGPAKAVWDAANGLLGRDELRRGARTRAYDLLVRRGLIHELAAHEPHVPEVTGGSASGRPRRGRRDPSRAR